MPRSSRKGTRYVSTRAVLSSAALPIRAVFNAFVLPAWTALCVSSALVAGAVTRDKDLFYRWQRHWARGLFRLCGIELEVSGEAAMAADAPYVIVANHASYMDVAALFAALPRPPQFIAKSELGKIPFLGAALRHGRHILIRRGNNSSALDAIGQAADHVRRGAAVLVFPEGTRATSDAVGRFKTGAFRLAKTAEAAILPVGIAGTRKVLPKHGRLLRPHPVRVHIGTPLAPDEVRSLDLKSLNRKARAAIAELAGAPLAGSEE